MRGKCSCGWEGIVNGKGQCMLCEEIEDQHEFEKAVLKVSVLLVIITGLVVFFSYETLVQITMYLMG